MTDDRRNSGLDLLRALAIVLVFLHHWRVFVGREPALGWLGSFGWVGVDLFFVLSGYLITSQVLRGLRQGRQLSLPAFWARRALRTWPAFWVVLAAYLLWPQAMGGRTPPPAWRFLTFTQNIGLPPGTAFSHAWSLCVEEQFYLLLPLAVLLGLRLGGGVRRAWAWLAVLLAAGMATRAALWLQFGHDELGDIRGYHPWLYYATWARADEFLPGVALALLQQAHVERWQRLTRHPARLTAPALLATAALVWALQAGYYIDDRYGFWMTAVGYSAVAACAGLWVLLALSPGSLLQRHALPGAALLARWSYAIYLTHKAVMHMLAPVLRQAGLPPAWQLAAVALASVAVGALLHRLVEAPLLAWRDRVVPSAFRPVTGLVRPAQARAA